MILVLDNYDSFTYNIVQYLEELGEEVLVKRNDEITVAEIRQLKLDYLVLSPGPGRPEKAGISLEVVEKLKGELPILGVCLGHQAIATVFGGKIIKAQKIYHGKVSLIEHQGKGLFAGLKAPLKVVRYHSLVIDSNSLPDSIEVTATSKEDNEVMGIRHRKLPIEGVQFHPESIGSEQGHELLRSFLDKYKNR